MSSGGRLSMTKTPRSSSTLAVSDRPAPDSPVTIVLSSSSLIASPGCQTGGHRGTSGRGRRVQSVVNAPTDRFRQPRHGHQLVLGHRPDLLHRPELLEEPLAPPGPETGDVVEHGAGHGLVAAAAVVGDGEAVGLVPDGLEEIESFGVAGDADRLRLPGEIDLLELP